MNASLVLLLLLLVSTCHGEEQDDFFAPVISATTQWENKNETPRDVSCPDATDIEPCVCTNQDSLTMDCSEVEDEEQLRKVFSAFFPTTEFGSFLVAYKGPKVLEDGVFGNVSFQVMDFFESVLETVQDDALTPSFPTLRQITIQYCQLSTFPFERLAEFTALETVGFSYNKIHTLPPLSSSTLQYFSVVYNLIANVSSDVFTHLSAAEQIYLNGNQLTEIPKETFRNLPKLQSLGLSYNDISYLQSHTFSLTSSPSLLTLDNNTIDFVEVDAFQDVTGSANITMNNNALTRLPEEVWRPVLEKGINLELAGNPLTCGCDVAWLVRDPQLLTTVTGARCADGTLLTDLNPADFDVCG